jgi:hypothetical protein
VEVEGYFVQWNPQCFNTLDLFWPKRRLREAQKRDEDIYEKLPLFEIEEKYGKTEGGRSKTQYKHIIQLCIYIYILIFKIHVYIYI